MSLNPDSLRARLLVDALLRGGVIACPTESVWGLSCDPWSWEAVQRLLALKQRPVDKGVILVAADMDQLEFLLHDLPHVQRTRLSLSWPGPNTWLVPHHRRVPPWVHGDHPTVAVRVTGHPGMAALCRAFGAPLVSTSANRAGCRPPIAGFQVRRYFGDQLDGIAPGAVGGNPRPSVIRDLATERVIRY
jgi:L-threonylcarbamoyladenylate synthase